MRSRTILRAKEPAFRGQDGDEDVVSRCDVIEQSGEEEIMILGHGIESLRPIERDDGDLAANLEEDFVVWVRRWLGHDCVA